MKKILFFMFVVLCTGCGKDEPVLIINLSAESLNFPSSGGEQSFTLESNAIRMLIDCDATWLSYAWEYKSSRIVDVTVTVSANTNIAQRTATITFSTNEENKRFVKVTQDGSTSIFGNGIVAAQAYGGGDGTQHSPYLISDAQQLKRLVDIVNFNHLNYANNYFKLMTDIEVTANEWIPIGSFRGRFDGNGYTIKGTLKSENYGSFGFFGALNGGARISNLTIAATVSNESAGSSSTGAIAGTCSGFQSDSVIISNCHITGRINGGISSTSYPVTGGITGRTSITAIRNCDISNHINGRGNGETGGIAASSLASEITNCKTLASASVSGNYNVGGIVGFLDWDTKINDCANDAVITCGLDSYNVGGIAGINRGGLISNCTNNASISCEFLGNTGGITGSNGDIIGSNQQNAIIVNCTNYGDISNFFDYLSSTGGITGMNRGVIHTSLNTGTITGISGYYRSNIGGIAGENDGQIYACCTNIGSHPDIGYPLDWWGLDPCPDGHAQRE